MMFRLLLSGMLICSLTASLHAKDIFDIGSGDSPTFRNRSRHPKPAANVDHPPKPEPNRSPVPSDAARAKALATIKDAFRDDYAAVSATDRARAAQSLLKQADETNDDITGKYVLLTEAANMAAYAGDYATASAAIDDLTISFTVSPAPLRLKALTTVYTVVTPTPANAGRVAEEALDLSSEASDQDDYATATDSVALADRAAKVAADKSLSDRVHARSVQLTAIQAETGKATAALKALASNPKDAEACLTIGRFYCFTKASWAAGLPFLSKGSDVALRDLALAELRRPMETAAQVSIGNSWWEFSGKCEGTSRAIVREHACVWYRAVQQDLSGLTRRVVDMRLAEVDRPATQPSDVRASSSAAAVITRRIVFACDASGSMINKMPSLKNELEKAVQALQSAQEFGLVFFSDEKSVSLEDNLIPATLTNKRKAEKFLEGINTTGTTNPIPGLELAFKQSPEVIYLLTDGDFPDNEAVIKRIRELNKDHRVKVNTIAFVSVADTDTEFLALLKQIAKENAGTFKRVTEESL